MFSLRLKVLELASVASLGSYFPTTDVVFDDLFDGWCSEGAFELFFELFSWPLKSFWSIVTG